MTRMKKDLFREALARFLGRENLEKIQGVKVGVAGAGGLGSNCAQFLARSGFIKFRIVDFDRVEWSNLNRQFYFAGQVGQKKVEALRENLLAIHRWLEIEAVDEKINSGNVKDLFNDCQVVVEALDGARDKRLLAEAFIGSGKLLVAASGLAGWGSADQIRIHRIRDDFFLVGDMISEVGPGLPPVASGVNVAAAKQADVVLKYFLEKTPGGDGMNVKRGSNCLAEADIYGITAEEYSLGRNNPEVVASMIDSGIKVIQYREKEKNLREKYLECLKIREMTRQAGVTFIVNDHVDLALLVKADGVHIGQDDLPPERVRELVGEKMIIGLSTHSPAQAEEAVKTGVVDYIGVGPIFATSTKKDVCQPVGLDYLDYVVRNINIPFVAIGGIKENNIALISRRGARCIALVTEIAGAEDIGARVSSLRAALSREEV